MKKIYTKPEIFFENFSLSTNIAGDCAIPTNIPTKGTCAIPDDSGSGLTLFGAGYCVVMGDAFESEDGFCYHVHSDNNRLFNS